MSRKIKQGSTGNRALFRIFEAGEPKTGVVYNTSGLVLWYKPVGGTLVNLPLVSAADLTETGGGGYEATVQDAAYTGSADLSFGGTLTDCVVVGEVHEIIGSDKLVAAFGALTTLGTTAPANWINAAAIAANALDGKGNWNVGKTGYSLTQTFPANFAALGINVSGHISRVTLVDTTTVNTDMRGTNDASTPVNVTTAKTEVLDAIGLLDLDVDLQPIVDALTATSEETRAI